jgi:plasmid stabilization system protein ParE
MNKYSQNKEKSSNKKMDKKFFVKWTAPAREDINEIIEYISKTNINYAIKILDGIEENVKKLDMLPERYRIVPELEKYGYLMYREIIFEYWRIVYKIENNYVYIMLIIDGRRNLEDLLLKKLLLREREI